MWSPAPGVLRDHRGSWWTLPGGEGGVMRGQAAETPQVFVSWGQAPALHQAPCIAPCEQEGGALSLTISQTWNGSLQEVQCPSLPSQ